MTASSRGSKAAASLIRSTRHPRVCSDYITRISRPSQRSYSAAAAAEASPKPTEPPSSPVVPPVTAHAASAPEYTIHSGLLLSRPPLLTKPPTPFEEAFYFYQKRLNERLVMPFTRYFYFKKDTPALADWKAKASERDWQPARELGGYNPYREDAWNDELLVGDKLSETTSMVDALVKESIPRVVDEKEKEEESEGKGEGEKVGEKKEEVVVVKPLPRITEADRTNDQTRLDRKLNRTLYLCVKRANGGWGLPAGAIEGRENLRDAAERILTQTGGVNMNTWIIGNAPAGHHILAPYYKDGKLERRGVKTFFMRARIMAGQANLKDNLFGLSEFKWLTKQEIEKHVAQKYFSAIRNMLHDR